MTITELDLRNNQLGAESGAYFAEMLKRNRVLEILDLRWNEIGS